MNQDSSLAIRWGADGLVLAVIQHAHTAEVLMVGHFNAESWRRTKETGNVWFWSRSRQELWEKGATSGNFLKFAGARLDCDGDTLLILAEPTGPTCHTGARTCFHHDIDAGEERPLTSIQNAEAVSGASRIMAEVFGIILERKRTMPEGSYVRYLMHEGVDKIDKKIGEEAAEVIIASKNGEPDRLASEMADLWFHSLVLLAACDMTPDEVWEQLRHRRG